MNRIFTFLFLCVSGLWAHSQTFYIADSILSVSSADINATDLQAKTYLINNSGQELDVTYTFNGGNTINSNWEVGFCTDATCDNPAIVTSGTFTMPIGDSVEIKITVLPMGNSDDLTGTVSFNAQGTTLDRVNMYYDLKVGTVGIKELNTASLSIIPNPATNFIQIKGINDIKHVGTVEVYSIIGKKMMHKEITQLSDLQLNVQNLDNGVYLVKLFDSSKNLFYTKTFVKK